MSAVPGESVILCHLREDGGALRHYVRIVVEQTTSGEPLSGRVGFDG
jgi:hypothetical protein